MDPTAPKKSDKGKRKMCDEGPSETHLGKRKLMSFAAPSLPPDAHFSQVQHILNAAAPKKPFSYTSMLTATDNLEDNIEPLYKDINYQREQIDHILALHNANLKQALNATLEHHLHDVHHEAEERAAKRLRQRESELMRQNMHLQSIADHYRAQADRMVVRMRTLERTNRALSERLDEVNAARLYAAADEEGESSFNDPDRVEPITLDCKVCQRKMATLMLWPCRHVCVCTRCDDNTTHCPVCRETKTNSIELYLPAN